MDKMLKDRGRSSLADHPAAKIKVVILEHDHRLVVAVLAHGEDFIREELVDPLVAFLPGVPGCSRDVGRARGVPEIVLQEPEERIGNNVVVEVVFLRSWDHESETEIGVVPWRADEHFTILSRELGPCPIAVGHRCRNPNRLPVFGNGADRGDHATASLPRGERAIRRGRK
jgi:hypothetical protein